MPDVVTVAVMTTCPGTAPRESGCVSVAAEFAGRRIFAWLPEIVQLEPVVEDSEHGHEDHARDR